METLNAVNEGMDLSLKLIDVFMLIVVLLTIAGFAIYLAGIAWFWFEGKRRSITEPRAARRASPLDTRRQARAPFLHKEIDMISRTVKSISLAVMTAILMTSALAQGQHQRDASTKANSQTTAAAQGSSTPGRIAKFTGARTVGDSNITEDDTGKIGIGTTLPTSQLTVNGVIEMLSGGGIKFPDGTLQTTAGLATVSRDATLKGDGTQASPLGLSVPLILNGQLGVRGVIQATNTATTGIGVVGNGGRSGSGVTGIGANTDTGFGGRGVTARGGSSNGFVGGIGLEALGGNGVDSGGEGARATGGDSNIVGGIGMNATGGIGGVLGGDGINATGGEGNIDSPSSGGVGVRAIGGFGFGAGKSGGTAIFAEGGIGANGAARGLAGFFSGNVQVLGTLSKSGGSFKIDHPLDPENKYLSHSFVESPDMKNIYDGVVSLDQDGEAVVEMPEWFGTLNRDFRYLLTAVGAPMPGLYIAEEITNNRFKISGGMAGMKVSWQVTGIRQDAWANKNRIKVEEDKSELERGHYLHPEAFGKAEERSVEWAKNPELMREIKQRRQEAEQRRQPHN
jgi:hypothetical protein